MTIVRTALVILAAASCIPPVIASTSTAARTPALGAVVFTGSTAYTDPQLFPAYRAHLGRGITSEATRAIAAAVTDLYVRDGFVPPEFAVDAALVDNGVLRIRVHEARVSRVVFEGEHGDHAARFDRIAHTLTAAVPLRSEDIQVALRDLRALPGVTVSATTRRDPARRNAHELVVQSRFTSVDGTVRVNNRGTEEVGPAFILGQVYANGLIGPRGRAGLVFATASNPAEYLGGGLLLDSAFGADNTRASLLLFHSRSAPQERPTNLDFRYVRDRASLRVSHPLRSSTATSLNVSAGFEADNLAIHRDGTRLREDRLRVLELALRASARASGGMQYSANLQLRHGLDGMGAGFEAADLVDDARRVDFLSSQLQATALRRFGMHWTARVDLFAQYSGHVLPDTERFKIGGDRLGRGFEVAEIAGDRGLGGKAELRRELLDAGGIFGRISSYGFYDAGTAWKEDRPGRDSATTAGIGLASAGASLTGYVEVAAPLHGPDIEGKRSASVFAELSWRF